MRELSLRKEEQLRQACRYGDSEHVRRVISEDRDATLDVDWEVLFKLACDYKQLLVMRMILLGKDTGCNRRLMLACLDGDLQYVQQHKGDFLPHLEGKMMYFQAAAYSKHYSITELLIQHGIVTLQHFAKDMYKGINTNFLVDIIEVTLDINVELRQGVIDGAPGFTALHLTCCSEKPNINILRALFIRGALIDKMGYNGRTGLHMLYQGKDDTIEKRIMGDDQLLSNRDWKDKQQGQKVQVTLQHIKCMRYLIYHGANVNAKDDRGLSPLHLLSCCQGSENNDDVQGAFGILLDNGVDINQQDNSGMTPLALCALHNNTKIASKLLNKNAKAEVSDKDRKYAIHKAVVHGHHEVVKVLIRHQININVQDITGKTPLHYAVENDDKEMTTVLLDANCLINETCNLGNTPLGIAIFRLMKSNKEIEKPIMTNSIAKALLEKGADLTIPNVYGESVLANAVELLNHKMVQYLWELGMDIHTRNNKQQSLLHTLVNSLNTHTNVTNKEVENSANKIMKILLPHLDINDTDINQQTPLHLAARAGCEHTINLLLKQKADVNVRDKFGFLPLMWAMTNVDAFNILWKKSLSNLQDEDFEKLMQLAFWKDKQDLFPQKEMKRFPRTVSSPRLQDVCVKRWLCNKDLSKFYLKNDETVKYDAVTFKSIWVSSLQKLTYTDHQEIVETLIEFIKEVQSEVSKLNPLLACRFCLSGSEREKTKVMATNEMDALSVLTAILFDMFETPEFPGHPDLKEFAKLLCKEKYRKKLKNLLDDTYYLSRSKLYHHYGKALSKVLANPKLWAKYPKIQRYTHKDISGNINTITALMVLWSDNVYPLLKISIDMVLAIDLPNWKPHWAHDHPLLDDMKCLMVPKWKATAIEDDSLFEIGISHWAEAFDEMPKTMKNGYRMAKVMKEVCPQIVKEKAGKSDWTDDWSMFKIEDCFTSYMLKQCIVRQYADGKAEENVQKTDREWAITIYDMLEKGFSKERPDLRSFFITDYNLLHDSKFKFLKEKAIKYAQLCKLLLEEKTAAHFRTAYMEIEK